MLVFLDGNEDNDHNVVVIDDFYHISQCESVQELVPEKNVFRAQLRYVAVRLGE